MLALSGEETLQWLISQITSLTIVSQPFIQAQIKENIKAPRHWPLRGNPPVTVEFLAKRARNTENVSVWWHHHEIYETTSHDAELLILQLIKPTVTFCTYFIRRKSHSNAAHIWHARTLQIVSQTKTSMRQQFELRVVSWKVRLQYVDIYSRI